MRERSFEPEGMVLAEGGALCAPQAQRQETLQGSNGAGDGIRTHELLRDKDLNLTPLTRLGDSRTGTAQPAKYVL